MIKKKKNMEANKKELILKSALKVFSSEGYHEAKVTKIAEIAELGAGTIYLEFKSKEDILDELFVRFWSSVLTQLEEMADKTENNPKQKLENITAKIIDIVSEQKEIAKIILQEHQFWSAAKSERLKEVVNNSRSALIRIIEDGSKMGIFREDLAPHIAAAFYTGGLWHLLDRCGENPQDFHIDNLKTEAIKLIFDGFLKR